MERKRATVGNSKNEKLAIALGIFAMIVGGTQSSLDQILSQRLAWLLEPCGTFKVEYWLSASLFPPLSMAVLHCQTIDSDRNNKPHRNL